MARSWTQYGPVHVYPADGGWDYRVIVDGKQLCGGWVLGTKREARAAAEEHAREKGIEVP